MKKRDYNEEGSSSSSPTLPQQHFACLIAVLQPMAAQLSYESCAAIGKKTSIKTRPYSMCRPNTTANSILQAHQYHTNRYKHLANNVTVWKNNSQEIFNPLSQSKPKKQTEIS